MTIGHFHRSEEMPRPYDIEKASPNGKRYSEIRLDS